jgi:deoxyhypusine synthase
VDSTIALPILTAYCLTRVKRRRLKRLYDRRDELYERIKGLYLKTGTVSKIKTSRKIAKRASSVGLKGK